jgi:hypothetical protein
MHTVQLRGRHQDAQIHAIISLPSFVCWLWWRWSFVSHYCVDDADLADNPALHVSGGADACAHAAATCSANDADSHTS